MREETIHEQDENLEPVDDLEIEDSTSDIPLPEGPMGMFVLGLDQLDSQSQKLTGMFKDWFLDYASYVILERAVPHLSDGLKPVQRRILHSMRQLEDGWYHKVANIIGNTMQYHPHGDASIGDALVQLGQKELLIDTQGNWGNTLTGDVAAAPRYIEARLTSFALETVFNPKTTEWMRSYDGRSQEPITLPVKFPLLLAQGADGIAVGLATHILPHNFNELLDAAIAYLKEQEFTLYPDFLTGGLADCSRYADGKQGGVVKIRAKVERTEKQVLTIREIPFGKTTEQIIDSIRKANEKGKIRVKKIEDNTAAQAEIIVHLPPDVSADKTIDALYAFTSCEYRYSPNACVIFNDKPLFLGVSDLLKFSVNRTKELLRQELEIRLDELESIWHYASLERIFIENEMYELIKRGNSWEEVIQLIASALEPFKSQLRRPVIKEDIVKLTELKFKRLSKFDKAKSDELIRNTEKEMAQVAHDLEHLVAYAITYYKRVKKKYGDSYPRRTELTSFDEILATRVVASNKKLYVDRENGFFGTELKNAEYVCECSDIDEIIVILRSGKYMVTTVQEKQFFEKDILYINVFKRNDDRTIYNLVYRDGKKGSSYVKRCAITSIVRDREYDLTKGTPDSILLYLSVNPNGEAEVIHASLTTSQRVRNNGIDFDFSTLAVRGKTTQGNLLSKYVVYKVKLLERGQSTLGGLKVWIDRDVNRLNYEERGDYLGEFEGNDRIVAIYENGQYQTSGFDLSTRFFENPLRIEKLETSRVYSAAYFNADEGYYYIKRFTISDSGDEIRSFIGENTKSKLIAISTDAFPTLVVSYRGRHRNRLPETLDVEEFIGVKSYSAKGKRITTYEVAKVQFTTPTRNPEE